MLTFGTLAAGRTCHSEGSLGCLSARVDNSWIDQLEPDPEARPPNKQAREVNSGHYVIVKPTPLPRPYLIACSPAVLELLEIAAGECTPDTPFVRLFAGDVDAVAGFEQTWATPYALSIYGSEVQPNGAGPTGNGYGDGRAVSIAEVLTSAGARWELQLKGAGKTPFCRNADGRAVLRSSVREYLASEAMHHMGVATTRALSLVGSADETVRAAGTADAISVSVVLGGVRFVLAVDQVLRPWYSTTTYGGDANASTACDDTDSRCALWAGAGECDRNAAFMEERCAKSCAKCSTTWSGRGRGMHGGDLHQRERCAITTRVARSYLRVGHFELFGRRARSGRGEAASTGHRSRLERPARDWPRAAQVAPRVGLATSSSWRGTRCGASTRRTRRTRRCSRSCCGWRGRRRRALPTWPRRGCGWATRSQTSTRTTASSVA